MKIENFEDVVPYIGRVTIEWWYRDEDKDKEYTYIDNITTYIKKVSDKLGIDYDKLYSDIKSNLVYYYSDPYKGPMKSEEKFTHIIDDSRVLWFTEVAYGEKGEIIRKVSKKVYPRLIIDNLYKTPISGKKTKGELKSRENYYNKKSKYMELGDIIEFFPEPDSSSYVIGSSTNLWNNTEKRLLQSLFTTEEEAKNFLESVKPKEKKKTKKDKTYDKFLEEADKLEAKQIQELIGRLEKLYDKKIDELDLNPLQIALTYVDKATEVDSFIPGEGSAIRDWVDENMDPNRYETVEYEGILERILEDYKEGAEWKDLKEDDKEVIQEIADDLRGGTKGFKWDW